MIRAIHRIVGMPLHIGLHKAEVLIVENQKHRCIVDGNLFGLTVERHALCAIRCGKCSLEECIECSILEAC